MFMCVSLCTRTCTVRRLPVFPQVHGSGGYDSDFSDDDGRGESSERGLQR